MSKLPKITNLLFLCNILERSELIKVDFLLVNKHVSFVQIDTMSLGMVKHSQSSQNCKFAMPLQYLKKQVRDQVFAYK